MSVGKRDCLSRLQTLWVFLILNGMAKTKLAILPFLCCGEIMTNSNESVNYNYIHASLKFFYIGQSAFSKAHKFGNNGINAKVQTSLFF